MLKPYNAQELTSSNLPIVTFIPEILATMQDNFMTVVTGATGSGKTTWLVRMAARYFQQKTVCTLPRRYLARTVAEYVAELEDVVLGEEVGFQTGLVSNFSKNTQIKFCTIGCEVARYIQEQCFEDTILFIDEVDLWGNFEDDLLAILEAKRNECKNFKVVAMSATLDAKKIAGLFGGDTPIISVPGRQYAITDHDIQFEDVVDIALEPNIGGKVLFFLPGKAAIKDWRGTLEDAASDRGLNVSISMLHAQMDPEAQDEAAQADIILTTNTSESGVTIPNVKRVISSGVVKRAYTVNGNKAILDTQLSQSEAKQQRGRCGRQDTGDFYLVYPPMEERPEYPEPEKYRLSQTNSVLKLLAADLVVEELNFVHPPSEQALAEAYEELGVMGAVCTDKTITDAGKLMAVLPLSPRQAKTLADSDKAGVLEAVIIISAIWETGSLKGFKNPNWRQRVSPVSSDFLAELQLWHKAVEIDEKIYASFADDLNQNEEGSDEYKLTYQAYQNALREAFKYEGLHLHNFQKAEEQVEKLNSMAKEHFELSCGKDHTAILDAMTSALLDKIYVLGNYGHFHLKGKDPHNRKISFDSIVHRRAVLVVAEGLDITTRRGNIVHLLKNVTCISPQWCVEKFPDDFRIAKDGNIFYAKPEDAVGQWYFLYYKDKALTEWCELDGNHPQLEQLRNEWQEGG